MYLIKSQKTGNSINLLLKNASPQNYYKVVKGKFISITFSTNKYLQSFETSQRTSVFTVSVSRKQNKTMAPATCL